MKQFLALTNELATPKILICITRSFARPGNGYSTETAASNWSTLMPTNIDYFVDLDANESSPERILAGLTGTATARSGGAAGRPS